MRKFISLAMIIIVLVIWHQAEAQNSVPMSNWRVERPEGNNPSVVTSADLTINQHSPLLWDNVNKEIARFTVQVRSLSNLSFSRGLQLELRVTYDDGLLEMVPFIFPGSNTSVSTVSAELQWYQGRVIKSMRLSHGVSGGSFHVTSFTYTPAPAKAVFINQSNLAGARLNHGAALTNNILVIPTGMPQQERPHITNVTSHTMQIVGSVAVIGFQDRKRNLMIQIQDRQGTTLRNISVPLGTEVETAEVDLSGIDLAIIDRVVFSSAGSGLQFAIRQINFGASTAVSGPGCPGLKDINARFEQKINEWKREGMLGNRYIQELETILREFKQLE